MAANPVPWFLPQNCYSYIMNCFETVSTASTSQYKQFLTLMWVFGLRQLCYQWKIPVTKHHISLFSQVLAVEDCEMSQIRMSKLQYDIFTSTRLSATKTNKRWYCSMLWDLVLWIPETKKMSPSHCMKLSCFPAPFPSGTTENEHFAIKGWPNVYPPPPPPRL